MARRPDTIGIEKTARAIKAQRLAGQVLLFIAFVAFLSASSTGDTLATIVTVVAFPLGLGLWLRAATLKWWHHD